jgi:hypothetical protein
MLAPAWPIASPALQQQSRVLHEEQVAPGEAEQAPEDGLMRRASRRSRP